MNKSIKGFLRICMLAVILAFSMAIAASAASASKADQLAKKVVLPLPKSAYYTEWELDKGGKIVKNSLKVSRPSVLKVTISKRDGVPSLQLSPRKKGSTKFSFKYKYKGKTKKYQFSVKVVKYTRPLKTFRIGSVNFAKQFKNNVVDHRTSGKLKGLVTVVPASGWTVKSITYVLRHNGSNYWDYYSAGTAVDVPHGGNVTVYMHNTQYGYDESFSVYYR